MKKKICLAALLLAFSALNTNAQTGTEILKKTDAVMYASKDQTAKVKIILTDKKGNQQEREAEYIQKGSEMRLFKFTAPASQQGIAFLSLPEDVMYIYLPAYEKERRIASHVKNQTFAGTDFSYDDMESKPLSDEYDAELLSQTTDAWKLKLVPKTGVESDYSRLEMLVNKDNNYLRQVDYYDRGGQKIKQLVNKKIEKVDGYWAATEMEMTDLVKEHSTIFKTSQVTFDDNLTAEDFTVREMKK
ncbi:MAG: outer membrane lipoprotein-sorting protein [Bacteroidales bacterium]|nr:outer membrane lipoprotein-sorting protein [Bacteroidales bacterium]